MNKQTTDAIVNLVKEAKALPIVDDMFSPLYSMNHICVYFFEDCILNRKLSKKTTQLLENYKFSNDVITEYQVMNNPAHPIRNALITNEIDLELE